MNKPRSKQFKRFRVTCWYNLSGEAQVDIASRALGWNSTVIPIPASPKKVAKELRKIAKWLEKR